MGRAQLVLICGGRERAKLHQAPTTARGDVVAGNINLEDEVRSTRNYDPRIAAPLDVAVSVINGLVTLRGTVATFSERHAIVEDVKALMGVDQVVDELKVRPLGDAWDEEIRGAALQMLMWDDDVPALAVDVKVANGP